MTLQRRCGDPFAVSYRRFLTEVDSPETFLFGERWRIRTRAFLAVLFTLPAKSRSHCPSGEVERESLETAEVLTVTG